MHEHKHRPRSVARTVAIPMKKEIARTRFVSDMALHTVDETQKLTWQEQLLGNRSAAWPLLHQSLAIGGCDVWQRTRLNMSTCGMRLGQRASFSLLNRTMHQSSNTLMRENMS